jgi:hypothetical protein
MHSRDSNVVTEAERCLVRLVVMATVVHPISLVFSSFLNFFVTERHFLGSQFWEFLWREGACGQEGGSGAQSAVQFAPCASIFAPRPPAALRLERCFAARCDAVRGRGLCRAQLQRLFRVKTCEVRSALFLIAPTTSHGEVELRAVQTSFFFRRSCRGKKERGAASFVGSFAQHATMFD